MFLLALYGLTAAFRRYLVNLGKEYLQVDIYCLLFCHSSQDLAERRMEGKDNEGKPPGLCHKIFRFLVKNLAFYTPRKVTIGRSHSEGSKPSIREEHAAKIVAGKGGKPPSGHSFDEEGEVPLVPPIITIPVEYPESLREKESDDRFKDRVLEQKKKKVFLDHPPSLQEQQEEGEVTGVRPAKPVRRLVSNIDSKVDAFIRERKRKQASDTS